RAIFVLKRHAACDLIELMRRLTARLIFVCVCAVMLVWGAAPIGSVTAPGQITISGANVPPTAAAGVPVGVGDEITTSDSTALIRFEDQGTLILGKHSSVKLSLNGEQILVSLTEGSFHYSLVFG